MALINSDVIPVGATGGATGFSIDQSLRFNDDDTAYLSWTPSSGGSATWTISLWVKQGNITTSNLYGCIFSARNGNFALFFENHELHIWDNGGNGTIYTTQLFRDPSAWYHIVVKRNTTSPYQTLYVNGSEVTDFSRDNRTTFAGTTEFTTASEIIVGGWNNGGYKGYDGYLAEVNFIDGQALDPTNFGETGTYGEWKPIEYTGTYGTNGFYLDFSSIGGLAGGAAYSFQTHNATITASSSASYNGSNTRTFEFWLRDTGSSWTSNSCFFGVTHDWYNPFIGVDSNGKLFFGNQSNGGANLYYLRSSIVPTLGNWNHYAVTISSKTVNLWVNGQNAGSHTYTTGTWSVINNWYFLTQYDNSDIYWQDVRISSNIRYSSAFSVPTTYFSDDSNTLILYQSTSSSAPTDNSGNGYLSVSGTVSTVTSTSPFMDTEGTIDDQSGNSNNFTTFNLETTDVVLDSPTNNFATWNPLYQDNNPTLSEGNLRVAHNLDAGVVSTFAFEAGGSTGYYCEFVKLGGTYGEVGLCPTTIVKTQISSYPNSGNDGYTFYTADGRKGNNGSYSSYGSAVSTNDIIGIAVKDGKVWWSINGTWQNSGDPVAGTGEAYSGISGLYYIVTAHNTNSAPASTFVANFGQDSSFAGNKTAQGNTDGNGIGDFYYEPPSGYLALCTANLPDPDVIPTEHFNIVLWTGDDTNNRTISGVGFQPDLTYLGQRDVGGHNQVYDAIGGYDKGSAWITSYGASEGAEATIYGGLGSVTSDGFVTSSGASGGGYEDAHVNWNNKHYVAWNWLASNGTSSNTTGSITSTVSVNQDAGLSVIAYDGTGSTATVGHGLSKAPEFIIIKDRDAGYDPIVYHHKNTSDPETEWLNLATNAATSDLNTVWNDTAPTSSVFTLGSNLGSNQSGHTFACYCFHGVDGYSKFDSYTGNGSTDGPFVYTGFRPAFVILKSATSTSSWVIYDAKRDTYNAVGQVLYADTSDTESDTRPRADFLSNGFKLRSSSEPNWSGETIIYIAFAENPFKYTNAR